jgi:hypothetical protein
LANRFAPNEERNPADKNASTDGSHLAVCDIVTVDFHPGVCVEAEQEAEGRLES